MIHLIVPLPQIVVGSREDTSMRVAGAVIHGLLAHMQVTLEKNALLDPVFDTVDTAGTFEEVGDPVPVEEMSVVKITLVCMYVFMYLCM